MILQRLAKAISKQNWSIVMIEVLVVVVGIIIGLQVDDWNEARKDNKDEQQFLVRLHGDLLLAQELSSRVRERRLDRLQSLTDAIDVLFGRAGRDTLKEEERNALSASVYFNINISAMASLSKLAGTGRMGIIRDANLRAALVELDMIYYSEKPLRATTP